MTAQPSEREARAEQAWDDSRTIGDAFWHELDRDKQDRLLAFADQERAEEREAEKERCARIAEGHGDPLSNWDDDIAECDAGKVIAHAIRNRKDQASDRPR